MELSKYRVRDDGIHARPEKILLDQGHVPVSSLVSKIIMQFCEHVFSENWRKDEL